MKFCENCGGQISESDMFCENCGAVIKAEGTVVPNYGMQNSGMQNNGMPNHAMPDNMRPDQREAMPEEKRSYVPLIVGLSIGGVLLLAVITVVIVLLVNGSVKQMSGAESSYSNKSNTNTDKKVADELRSMLATCITDFETVYGELLGGYNREVTLQWSAKGVKITEGGTSDDDAFLMIISSTIGNDQKSKSTGKYATAQIQLKGETAEYGYAITVTVGEQTSAR